MMDRTHDHLGPKVSAIVDDAIAELLLLDSSQSRDDAAFLMACQAIVRIDDNEKMKEVGKFADDLVWYVDDTEPNE
jgi:hypothetical protein